MTIHIEFVAASKALPHEIVEKIGKQLRDAYDAVIHEPLPDEIHALLSEMTR
ncbi:MAG: NepR family anti-sigma factor [Methylocystis sp.]|uniref:NepR family anti-sigma factor n=1 Tax=Methylocystis sp. TaxID=1911079 RepID=UPI003D0DCBB8